MHVERWSPGDEVLRLEVWDDRVWTGLPMRVVADDPDLLALYLPAASPVGFNTGRWPIAGERHPWDNGGPTTWWGHGALHLHRPGDAYCVIVFWEGEDRTFSRWYVNFQAPFRRRDHAIETLDHVLDIVVEPDGQWAYKDADDVDTAVGLGLFDHNAAAEVRRQAEAVGRMLDDGTAWWDSAWATWSPPAGLDVPYALPSSWAD